MLRSSLVFTCFNFCHYWGQGGPFSPGDLSISSQMSWGTTMWIWVDQSQRSMFFKAENCSYVSSAMICRSKTSIVHNCIIFFCSLDVRNIVQGGDPLYAVVNHKEGCGGHYLPKWVHFLQKTPAYSVDSKISFFGPRGFFFLTFLSFQNLLSLFKIYWVHYISGRSLQLKVASLSNLPSFYWVSVNLEGPVLEPARSHQINKRISFQNLLRRSVNSEKNT